jgi:hypothetical protein
MLIPIKTDVDISVNNLQDLMIQKRGKLAFFAYGHEKFFCRKAIHDLVGFAEWIQRNSPIGLYTLEQTQ